MSVHTEDSMDPYIVKAMITALRELKERVEAGDVPNPTVGICWHLTWWTASPYGYSASDTQNLVDDHTSFALEALGYNTTFPVVHPTTGNAMAYDLCNNKWDLKTEYGQTRFKLLNDLIAFFEKFIAKVESND